MQSNELHPEHHFINGQWIKGKGDSFHSINPATKEIFWQGCQANESEVTLAVKAAHEAYSSWSSRPFSERARCVKKYAVIVGEKKETLAKLIAMENGKPYWEALTEAAAVIGKVELSIKAAQERTGNQHFSNTTGDAWLRYKPHGVVAVLGAFNFPAHLSNGHIVPALLAGNTVVLKPSELTPAVSQFISQCWQEAGVPPGVLNCVQGGGKTGQILLEQDLQGVYFTGSYATGKRIHQQFAGRPEIILALEMGGNNPLILDDVKDSKAAVYQTVLSTMISSGQRCTCARRLMVPDTAFGQEFTQALIRACSQLTIGAWNSNPEPFMGPVIRPEHAKRHLEAQEHLINIGGEPLLKMTASSTDSAFLTPGIIDMTAVQHVEDEELFAPFVQLFRYRDFDEAILLANQTQYGLSAGLLSDDPNRYEQFYNQIRAGLVNWNKPTTGAAGNMPFGGVGRSGNHRPSAYFAADYCAYPVASVEHPDLTLPDKTSPGITLD